MPPLEKKQCYSAARPAHATRPPPKTPPMRPPATRRTPSPPRRSRSPARDGPQTEALIAMISELTSVVSPLVAERDQARASASSSYRRRRSRSDSWDSRRRGRSRSPRESRYEPWTQQLPDKCPFKKLWNKTWQMVSETVHLTTVSCPYVWTSKTCEGDNRVQCVRYVLSAFSTGKEASRCSVTISDNISRRKEDVRTYLLSKR